MGRRIEPRPPVVSSISIAFKRALTPTEDVSLAKVEHRTSLKSLMDDYMERVQVGEAEGIRNAKDLVEVMKMDLLLMGEATERTDATNTLDEIRVNRVAQAIDMNDPNVQSIISSVMLAMNETNDDADKNPSKAMSIEVMDEDELDDSVSDNEDDSDSADV